MENVEAAVPRYIQIAESLIDQIEAGELVPDEVMNAVVAQRLGEPDCAQGFLLDGFPRTGPQAEALDAILKEQGRGLDAVLYVGVPREELIRRCGANFNVESLPAGQADQCPRCGGALEQRADDQPETVANRLEVYHRTTASLVSYYQGRGLLRQIDGVGSPEDVYERVLAVVGSA